MKAEYINPFIASIDSVFNTMLHTTLERQQMRVGCDAIVRKGQTLTSIIGISGAASGVVALSFPLPTALALAGKFIGTQFTEVTGEVTDALAELVNIVGGSAKSKFELDPPPELSMPTVVEGCDYRMKYPTTSAWVEIPFKTPVGEFSMDVSFSKEAKLART